MKQILFFLWIALTTQLVKAQSVGIGTTTPNPKAALDISSTTKGLLIPSMTTVQRQAITTPPNGLMVYDTDFNEFYHRDGVAWRKLLNSLVWTPSTTRRWVYNFTDSIGIGTSTPDERLEVNGNIRSRGNLLADNNITALGTGLVSGDLTTNADLIINNATATMQLKSSSVNKGFFQLSGNNVRMGTNSGNSTGNLIIRMNANDRVTINPAGDIDLDGKITRTAVTGNAPLLPVCMGQVSASGGILNGTGNFTVAQIGPGTYQISSSQFSSNSIMMVTGYADAISFGMVYVTPGKFNVGTDGGGFNTAFHFIVYNLN